MPALFRRLIVLPFIAAFALGAGASPSRSYMNFKDGTLILDNSAVRRVLVIDAEGRLTTTVLQPGAQAKNFVTAADRTKTPLTRLDLDSAEFRLLANGRAYTGSSGWELVGCIPASDEREGSGATLQLRARTGEAAGLRVEVTYLLYPRLPVVRKKLRVINDTPRSVRLESVDVEALNPAWHPIDTNVRASYGRYRAVGPFVGTAHDSVVAAHSEKLARGLILGTEAPGVTKRLTVFADGRSVSAGLTQAGDAFPFRQTLEPGGTWDSPWAFVAPYEGTDAGAALAAVIPDLVRRHLGLRLAQAATRPTFVYNTWMPFRTDINAQLITELADAAAACGVKEFVIDDGWQTRNGEWEIDRRKFPDGLKPVFDHIKARGMKPGLWISLAAVSRESRLLQEHPEWMVRDADGTVMNLHEVGGKNVTACLTTGWKEHLRDIIVGLVREHGLQYVKLDLAIVASAYTFDPRIAGCSAPGHSHRDRAESLLHLYQRAWELFDELHAAAPDLFIDCTFETMGAAQLIDLDMCKHAEGNWLSNFEEVPPFGSRRVRQMAWWRSGTIPAGALVIGNQSLEEPGALLSFQSLTGALPIMLGDPRQLTPAQREEFGRWAGWFQGLEDRHQVMLYRQDLAGFGEPEETVWDGFQRINTETRRGGLVAVFRNRAVEATRTVYVRELGPADRYDVLAAPDGRRITTLTGEALAREGFPVTVAPEGSALFEVVRAQK